MSQPLRVDDGNFGKAQQNGAPSYQFPFADKGDNRTFIATVKVRCDYENFIPPTLMNQRNFSRGKAYLVDFTDPKQVDESSRLLEWENVYASLPQTRNEYGSTTYTQQWWQLVDGAVQIITDTAPMAARFQYEYFLNEPPPVIYAPKLVQFGSYVVRRGGYGKIVEGAEALAEDTVIEIWKCRIYVRKSIFIRYHGTIVFDGF